MLGKRLLDRLLVQELSAELEREWQLIAEDLSILLDLNGMSVLQLGKSLAVLFLGLKQILIPLLVELLILLDVCLLALLTLLGLVEDELVVAAVIVLLLELSNTVLRHFGLNILPLALACLSVLLQDLAVSKIYRQDTQTKSF